MLKVIQNINNYFNNYINYIKFNRNIRIAGILSSFVLLLLTTLFVYPIVLRNTSAEATAGTPTPSTTTLSMTVEKGSASLNIIPKDNNGTFAVSTTSQLAEFGVTTDNYTGYQLLISGSDDDGLLSNSSASSSLSSISSATTDSAFNSSSALNGKWGYMPSKYNSSTNVAFLPSPTHTSPSTLDTTTVANATDANTYTIGLGARINYSTPAGNYTNTFTLQAVGNPIPFTITYADNTGDTSVANLPSITSGSTSGTTATLSSTIPTRDGYTFNKWCLGTVTGTTSNPGTICTGEEYSAGSNFGIDQTITDSAIVSLYATWTPINYDLTINFSGYGVNSVKVCTISGDCSSTSLIGTVSTDGGTIALPYNNTYYLYPVLTTNYEFLSWENDGTEGTLSCEATDTCSTDSNPTFLVGLGEGEVTITGKPIYMQNLTKSMCAELATDAPITMTDIRDSQTYTVRYIDTSATTGVDKGTCWMTENLKLGYNASNPETYSITLSNIDTNITASSVTLNLFDLEKRGTNTSGKNQCYGTYIGHPDYIGAGPGYVNSCIHSGSNAYTSGDTVWYNYAAATAGTIKSSSDTDTVGDTSVATESICPKGWTLPSQYQIDNIGAYGSPGTDTYVSIFSPVAGGNYMDGVSQNFEDGYWWSSDSYTDRSDGKGGGILRYRLNYYNYGDGGKQYTQASTRRTGYYIRCVSDEKTVEDLYYMQDMSPTIASNTENGQTATLTDRRDNKTYTVAKINGNIWMTQNLRFGYDSSNPETSTLTLTEQDSNITFTSAERTAGKRVLTVYDQVTRSTGGSNECYGTNPTAGTHGSGPGYFNPCIHSGANEYSGGVTVWYNYVAATAGTIKNASTTDTAGNTDTATQSLCPKGWTLPSKAQSGSLSDGTTGTNAYVPIFNPVYGGVYANSVLNYSTTAGIWVTSEAYNDTLRWRLRYNQNGRLYTDDNYRGVATYIRCVQSD